MLNDNVNITADNVFGYFDFTIDIESDNNTCYYADYTCKSLVNEKIGNSINSFLIECLEEVKNNFSKKILVLTLKEEDQEEYYGTIHYENINGNHFITIIDNDINYSFNTYSFYVENETINSVIIKERGL